MLCQWVPLTLAKSDAKIKIQKNVNSDFFSKNENLQNYILDRMHFAFTKISIKHLNFFFEKALYA